MAMLRELTQFNYLTLVMAVFLIVFILVDNSFHKRVKTLFLLASLSVLVLTFSVAIDYWRESLSEPSVIRSITTATGYAFRPATLFFICCLIKRRTRIKALVIAAAPLMANALLAYVSVFTGLVFTFDAENHFHRGPFGYFPFVVSGFYLLLMIIWTFSEFRFDGRAEMVIIFLIAFFSVLSTVMESAFKFKFLLNGTIAASIIFYYIYFHVQVYARDALTGAMNRRCFFQDAEKNKKNPMVIVTLDMNGLKLINDNHGHLAGDKALITVVRCIRSGLLKGCTLYRTGGDEFMIICPKKTVAETEEMLKDINGIISETDYGIASGISEYKPGDNFESICITADRRMYENKATMKDSRYGIAHESKGG